MQHGLLIRNTLDVMHCEIEKHNGKPHEIPIWGEGYTKGSHGPKRSQQTAVFVAHTGEKTRMFDFTASLICAHKEREGGLCGCCAVVENSYSLCWPMAKESPRDWELEMIEIS